jgi:GNAT superfamily N-acetyltransferase
MIEIRTGDRRAAFDAGRAAYGDASPYVTPMWSDFNRILDPDRNPFCRDGHGRLEVFTAHRDGRAVGRIAASIHDASNVRHNTQRGQFGFFDCNDDPAAAASLLAAAETWLAHRDVKEIVGNFNLTAMQMAGVVTSGFAAQPYTDMMWSPPHIAKHLERNGYVATFPMATFETELASVPEAALGHPKLAAIAADPRLTWHPITRASFKDHLEDARLVLNAGFDRNPMFVPLSAAEYTFQAGEMMWIMDPRLSVVVHYDRKPAGVIVCIPDLNPFVKAVGGRLSWAAPWHFISHRLHRERAVIIYYSVVPELHGRGLNGAMLARVVKAARRAGYRTLGTTWIADVNVASLKQMDRIGAKPLQRLHLFTKTLGIKA